MGSHLPAHLRLHPPGLRIWVDPEQTCGCSCVISHPGSFYSPLSLKLEQAKLRIILATFVLLIVPLYARLQLELFLLIPSKNIDQQAIAFFLLPSHCEDQLVLLAGLPATEVRIVGVEVHGLAEGMTGLFCLEMEGSCVSLADFPARVLVGSEISSDSDVLLTSLTTVVSVFEWVSVHLGVVSSLRSLRVLAGVGAGKSSKNISILHSSKKQVLFQHSTNVNNYC